MKLNALKKFVVILCCLLFYSSVYAEETQQEGDYCLLTAEQIPFRELDTLESESLLFMHEEEKLARDVYLALFDLYGTRVFSNISGSEQQHMDTLKAFVDAWRLDDPILAETGEFSHPDLQVLYDELVAKGSVSALEAFKVGALIEEIDIDDLQNAIEETQSLELKQAYQNLQAASFNHLRAFAKQIINLEGSYTAQHLSSELVDSILSTASAPVFQGNALLYDGQAFSSANACFVSVLEDSQGSLQNGSYINSNTVISMTHTVKPLTEDINQPADWVMVAFYSDAVGQNGVFARHGDNWEIWDGNINHLTVAESAENLAIWNTLPVFQGMLTGLSGQLQIHSGYRVDDGRVVFNQFPLIINLNE